MCSKPCWRARWPALRRVGHRADLHFVRDDPSDRIASSLTLLAMTACPPLPDIPPSQLPGERGAGRRGGASDKELPEVIEMLSVRPSWFCFHGDLLEPCEPDFIKDINKYPVR